MLLLFSHAASILIYDISIFYYSMSEKCNLVYDSMERLLNIKARFNTCLLKTVFKDVIYYDNDR